MNLQTLEYFPDVEQVEPRHSKANKPIKTVHVQLSSKQLLNHGTEERKSISENHCPCHSKLSTSRSVLPMAVSS